MWHVKLHVHFILATITTLQGEKLYKDWICIENRDKMALFAVLVILLAAVSISPAIAQQQSCAACNCPLDSDQDLDGYVSSRINEIMGNEPRK